jgi:prolyl oligopeptidase PreP (S9A serine peptidase family)
VKAAGFGIGGTPVSNASPDGSISLAQIAPSPNGKFLAYTLSEGGADWQTVHVRDLTTGRDTAIEWIGYASRGSRGLMTGKAVFTVAFLDRRKENTLRRLSASIRFIIIGSAQTIKRSAHLRAQRSSQMVRQQLGNR